MKTFTAKLGILALVVSMPFMAWAQGQKTTGALTKSTSKLRSPYSLSTLWTTETSRDRDNEFNGTKNWLEFTGKYKVNRNVAVRVRPSFSYITERGEESEADVESIGLHFIRYNVLNQKDHYISGYVEARAGYLITDNLRRAWGSTGDTSFRLNFKNRYGKFTLISSLRYYHYILNDYKTKYSYENRRRAYMIPEYKFNKNWQVSLMIDYNYITRVDERMNKEYLELSPQIRYNFSRNYSLSLSNDWVAMQSFDGETFVKDARDESTYALRFYAKLF